jgi:hypothetical protein
MDDGYSDQSQGNEDSESNLTYVGIDSGMGEIVLPPSIDGRDRFVSLEKITPETINPLVKREISVESVIEVIDRSFSYPMTAHVGLKFDSRTFSNFPKREFDVKMKKVKVPSNYYAIGGNGLDRRYIYTSPNFAGDPSNLDIAFVVDQNMNYAQRQLLIRNIKEMISKLVAGYTFVRASIWQTSATQDTTLNEKTGEKLIGFTYYETDDFFEIESPDSSGGSNTNLLTKLTAALNFSNKITTDPTETSIANFFLRRSQFGLTDEAGTLKEEDVLSKIWVNTVRKVVYFSGSEPETMSTKTYAILLNHAQENAIQIYYIFNDANSSGTRTLRELAVDSGGGKFNCRHDSDIEFQKFCSNQFYDHNKIYYGDWDGTFKIAWTDNPAWVLYDIITDTNYGLGNYIDNNSIDKWTLYDIGRYCDAVNDKGFFEGVSDGKGGLEPRYTCNIIFGNKDEAYKVIKDIAAIFKGIVYWNTEGFSFFADRPKQPIMYFANSNVKDGAFNYTETAKNLRYTSVEVVYNDKFDNFKTKIEFVEDVDGIRTFGLNPFKVNAAGCTSRSEARRIGRYILHSSMFEADTVSFTAGLEGAYLQPGDIFAVSDELKNVARTFGRILSVDTFDGSIRIDGEFATGLDSGIYIHVPSGNFAVSDLNSMTGSDGSFSGTLDVIRARRQSQVKKYNICAHTDLDYGALLTLTGNFLLKSGVVDVHVDEGRISGSSQVTGETNLDGSFYTFPEGTIIDGNPTVDTVSFSEVSGLLKDLEIDIDVSGTGLTGQLIGNESNWTGVISYSISSSSTLAVNGSTLTTLSTDQIYAARLTIAGAIEAQTTLASLDAVFSNAVFTSAATGQAIVVFTRGGVISNGFNASSTWATDYGATEIYKIGRDSSGTSTSFGYACAFIKGGYRIIERASKALNDYGSLRFTYRDLLAFSKLRGYYTFLQAEIGNDQQSVYGEWTGGRKYEAGNIVKFSGVVYTCTRDHDSDFTNSTGIFSNDYNAGNSARSKWLLGSTNGYSVLGFPKDFFGSQKTYINQSLTASGVLQAFATLGIEMYSGAGTFGQTDIRTLKAENGIGFSGFVYGTGFEKGFYSLSTDTTPKNLDLISAGSLYVLSGSGVEPKLYKTIATKEEEANQYGIVGIEFNANKEEFIERDIIDTSPNLYVKSVYDVVIKPDSPAYITGTGIINSTGLYFNWPAVTTTPINGYKVYVSRPDYSSPTLSAMTQAYFVASGTTGITIDVSGKYGQYDINVYGQGVNPYKLLSDDNAAISITYLPTPSLSITGQTVQSTFVSGIYVETADTRSLDYKIYYTGTGHSGLGAGNFTSRDLTFRWAYMDPTGGAINSVEKMKQNIFMPLIPKVKVSVLDMAGQVLHREDQFQGFSYKIDINDNKKFVNREDSNWQAVQDSRNFGLKLEVTDNTNRTFTGTYYAYNVPPQFSTIEVIDCYQNSPYYILSGYYGNSTFTGIAIWDGGTGIYETIYGSGVRGTGGALLRSEDERDVDFFDISGAFKSATGFNGTGEAATRSRKGVNINFRGSGTQPDYEAYVNSYEDLINYYNSNVKINEPEKTKEVWGSGHYIQYGSGEGRDLPRTKDNPLGISDLSKITNANQTGFSGVSFTVFPERVAEGRIIFDCYSITSNKDLLFIDVYTGASGSFEADIETNSNQLKSLQITSTRSYVNTFSLSESDGLEVNKWHYFRFVAWDDFGPGPLTDVYSGYLTPAPIEDTTIPARRVVLNSRANEDNEVAATTMSKNYKYKIVFVGTTNWKQIGATEEVIGHEFIYNGATISGTGKVKMIELPYQVTPEDLNQGLIKADTKSDSSMVVPTDVGDGQSLTVVNQGNNNIYVRDSNGETIATIRPDERLELIKEDGGWVDPRGNILSLE